jgi:hypothetical protein
MNDQAASALGNISVWAWIWYSVAGALIGGLFTAGLVLAALWWRDVAVIAWHLARFHVRRRKLVTAISKVDGAQRATRPMDLGDLVIHRETERHAAYRASCLTEVIGHEGRSDTGLGDIDPDPELGGDQ